MFAFKFILPIGASAFLAFVFSAWEGSNHSMKYEVHSTNIDSLIAKNNRKILSEALEIKLDTPYVPSRFPYYRPKDRYSDLFSTGKTNSNLFYNLPSLYQNSIDFLPDSAGNNYQITEQLNGKFFRSPTLLSDKEMYELMRKKDRRDIWKELAEGDEAETATSARNLIPKIPIESEWFDRIFGGDFVEFKPVGFVNLDFAVQQQKVANPNLPIRQQKVTNFNFDPHANINLTGKVGDKVQIGGSFDTKSSFQFENNFKLEYRGYEEDILRKVEFGNMSFPLTTTLIQGGQNLFGIGTELQFGKLKVRSVFSQQRARAESINLQGGAQRRNFEIAAGDYEDNRHFFLAQFFRNIYERSLATLPVINSGVQITRLEVYVTNRVNNTQDTRNIAAFLDLGEAEPFNQTLDTNPASEVVPRNDVNNLFSQLQGVSNNSDNIANELTGLGLSNGQDFAVVKASRKLKTTEYKYNAQLGYISLLTPLRNDEVLAVAFEYTYQGRPYKVGELADDYANREDNEIIRLKMLRPAQIRLDLPTWDLMMKNVYSLNASQVSRQNFLLRVIYKDDLTGIDNPTLQEGTRTKDVPLLQLLGLDRLNPQNDPARDGNFDFVEGVTIDSQFGRIFFPVLEPFGTHLERQFDPVTETALINKFVFTQLYRSTKADALQAADKNKFFLAGSLEASASTDISLPGINIAEGSVRVTAGGIPLVENEQFVVDYSSGRVEIIDPSIINSGKEIKIDYEKADLFNFQIRRLFGTRFDYEVFRSPSKELLIGATLLNQRERPVITRVNVGDEPVNNTMLGFDVNYKSKSRLLTKLVDALPFIQTKEESNITFYGEYAQLFPNGSPRSGEKSLIDDFEGTRTAFNLGRNPQLNWRIGATPQLIAEATSTELQHNFRRAKLAWYNVDNLFYRTGGVQKPDGIDTKNHYIRAVPPQEVFPFRQRLQIQTNEIIFDMAYYPEERGPYNYNPNINGTGRLNNPRNNFAAITRAITSDIDFDNANIEYLEFWMMDPFIAGENGRVLDGVYNQNNTTGVDLFVNLGNVSEDVLPDGRQSFENGLPITGATTTNTTENIWGRITNQQYLTNAFDNAGGARENQDIGLEGLKSTEENTFTSFQNFINAVNLAVTDPEERTRILNDISADDFQYFLGGDFDARNTQILERYKNFNGLEGNSPLANNNSGAVPASTNVPDNEDLNVDNTISNVEAYYQYKIPIRPSELEVGKGYIIDKVTNQNDATNNESVSWYLFRIPVRQFDQKIGNINGFKSIRFLRMFMNNAERPIVLRFAQYQLVANQWRRYLNDLSDKTFGLPIEPYDANFNVSTVNIEENGAFSDGDNVTPYVLPPGVIRDQDVTNTIGREQNEQSMRLCVTNLRDKDARAVFRNYNLDFLSYKRVKMFIHAETEDPQNTQSGDVSAFIRLGTDYTDNFYEIEVLLEMTPNGTSDNLPNLIWPSENEIDVPFSELTRIKTARNQSGQNKLIPFSEIVQIGNRRYRITVVGNPDLSAVLTAMIGVRNPDTEIWDGQRDDKQPKTACIWVNEFRIEEFDKTAGYAVLGRANIKLADFANITASASYTTFGFGSINQRISERARETTTTFDIAGTVALDKFLPTKWGIRLPAFASYERRNVSPRFNPLDPDIALKTSLANIGNEQERQEYENLVEENATRRSFNFSNVRKERMNPESKVNIWDIENFAFTYAYSEEVRSNVTTASFINKNTRYGITYSFQKEAKYFEPFKKLKFLQSKYLALIKDFNFSLMPSSINISADLDKKFTRTLYRAADLTTIGVTPLFQKSFLFNRSYAVNWNFTKSLGLSYNALANAIIDEPEGDLDTQAEKDSVLNNLKRLGRMKNFNQNVALTYKIPLDKIPFLNWITNAQAGYNATYTWTAGAVGIADTLGNTASNTRARQLGGTLDFSKLYQKSKFLKSIETPAKKPAKDKKTLDPKLPKDTTKKKERNYELLKAIIKPMLMLKSINVNYSITEATILPGFKPSPKYFGLDETFNAPGWEFVMGSQSADFRQKVIENDWLASSASQNNFFMQNRRETLKIDAILKPVNDFNITLSATRERSANYQSLFRNIETDPNATPIFEIQNPNRTGGYSISIISLKTIFKADNSENISPNFTQFEQNRTIVRARLNAINSSYEEGVREYGLNSQDVLIPAFLAAYTGQSALDVNISPFPKIPLPNWKVDYTGLAKLEIFKDDFSQINITHAYSSLFSVNNYTTSLQYGEQYIDISRSEFDYISPDSINVENQFIPIYILNQVVIDERFTPLIGINIRTKKNLTIKIDWTRDRNLSLNLTNSQVAEIRNQSIVFGFGFIKKNVKLPFKSNGKTIVLKNDLDMRLDFTLRDTKTVQRQLDDAQVVTGGNLNIQIRPVINYVVNQQLSFQCYFEKNINNPRISNSFPRVNTNVGVQLRYNITQ